MTHDDYTRRIGATQLSRDTRDRRSHRLAHLRLVEAEVQRRTPSAENHLASKEAYIQFTPGMITGDGEVTVESTEAFLRTYMKEFHDFITRVRLALPPDD